MVVSPIVIVEAQQRADVGPVDRVLARLEQQSITPQDGRMASDLLREAGRQSEAKPVCPSSLRVDTDGDHIVLSREEGLAERRLRAIREVAGSMPGVYESGYLHRLRDEWC